MYTKIPFRLMNPGEKFQRDMDISFVEKNYRFVVIYLDDIIVFSRSNEDHLEHLKKVFQRCRRFGLSLNPKKSKFALLQNKLLGHIISRDGIKIDPSRVATIQKVDIPKNAKEI